MESIQLEGGRLPSPGVDQLQIKCRLALWGKGSTGDCLQHEREQAGHHSVADTHSDRGKRASFKVTGECLSQPAGSLGACSVTKDMHITAMMHLHHACMKMLAAQLCPGAMRKLRTAFLSTAI